MTNKKEKYTETQKYFKNSKRKTVYLLQMVLLYTLSFFTILECLNGSDVTLLFRRDFQLTSFIKLMRLMKNMNFFLANNLSNLIETREKRSRKRGKKKEGISTLYYLYVGFYKMNDKILTRNISEMGSRNKVMPYC